VLYYYTPDGQVSSANPPPTIPHFWVQHVNRKIEIGWNDLPVGTVQIIVSRSGAMDGPWSQLLLQNQPVTTNYVIRLVDNTIGEAYYYKLDANGNNGILGTFGPELLPPLAE